MDMARTCFKEWVKFYTDSNELTQIEWYEAKPGAVWFDGTQRFGTPVWDQDIVSRNPPVGVQIGPPRRVYSKGSNNGAPPGTHWHGAYVDWQYGMTAASRIPYDGFPPGICTGNTRLGQWSKGLALRGLVQRIQQISGTWGVGLDLAGDVQRVEQIAGTWGVGLDLAGDVQRVEQIAGTWGVGLGFVGKIEGRENIAGRFGMGLAFRGVVQREQIIDGREGLGKAFHGDRINTEYIACAYPWDSASICTVYDPPAPLAVPPFPGLMVVQGEWGNALAFRGDVIREQLQLSRWAKGLAFRGVVERVTTINGTWGLGKALQGVLRVPTQLEGTWGLGKALQGVQQRGRSVLGRFAVGKAEKGLQTRTTTILGKWGVGLAARGEIGSVGINYLINGGFDFFQRTTPAAAWHMANNTYGPDRWVVLTNSAGTGGSGGSSDITITRGTSTINSLNNCTVKQNNASAKKWGMIQWLETADTFPLRSLPMVFALTALSSSTPDLRVAFLQWNGTGDSLSSIRDVVNDWTHSADSNPATTFLKTGTFAVLGSSSAVTLSGSEQQLTCTGTVQANSNNVAVFVWTPTAVAQNVTVSLTKAMMGKGSIAPPWEPLNPALELVRARRYFEKSYDLDTAPGSAVYVGMVGSAWSSPTNTGINTWPQFRVAKRAAPTLTVYDGAGTAGKCFVYGPNTDGHTATTSLSGQSGFKIDMGDGSNAYGLAAHYAADAEL